VIWRGDGLMTGIQLEEIYVTHFRGSFPYADCRWLASHEGQPVEDLIPELDMYFSNIAGYSSSASRLGERPASVLRKARKTLALNFFETYPSCERYSGLITSEKTPKLYEQMRIAEQLRLELLEILELVA
jgi:hypothetical protein